MWGQACAAVYGEANTAHILPAVYEKPEILQNRDAMTIESALAVLAEAAPRNMRNHSLSDFKRRAFGGDDAAA
jgi:hypothetical protein